MEVQFMDCQNMLVEIEQKVVVLLELLVYNENLLLEGKVYIKDEVEQLVGKLRRFKGSLLELQRVLYDKQFNMQGIVQEKEESDVDLIVMQSFGVQEWLV